MNSGYYRLVKINFVILKDAAFILSKSRFNPYWHCWVISVPKRADRQTHGQTDGFSALYSRCKLKDAILGFRQNFQSIPIMNHYRGSWYYTWYVHISILIPYRGIWLRAEIFANKLFRSQKKCMRFLYLRIRGVYWIVSHTCACVWCDRRLLLHPLLLSMSVSFTVDSMVLLWFKETIFTRLFGTAILVKNSVVCRRT